MWNKTKQQQKPVLEVRVGKEDRKRISKGHVERKRKRRSNHTCIFFLTCFLFLWVCLSLSLSSGIWIQDPNPQANCQDHFLREPGSGKVRQRSNVITTSLGLGPRTQLDSCCSGLLWTGLPLLRLQAENRNKPSWASPPLPGLPRDCGFLSRAPSQAAGTSHPSYQLNPAKAPFPAQESIIHLPLTVAHPWG